MSLTHYNNELGEIVEYEMLDPPQCLAEMTPLDRGHGVRDRNQDRASHTAVVSADDAKMHPAGWRKDAVAMTTTTTMCQRRHAVPNEGMDADAAVYNCLHASVNS